MTGVAAWAAARRQDPVLDLMKRRALQHLVRDLPRGSRICDVGCGTGEETAALSRLGFRVVAMDADPRMLELARRRFGRRRIDFRRASFGAPPGDLRGRCAAVLSFHAANFPPGLTAFARACTGLLAPGGRAVFTTTMRWAWQDWIHEFRRREPGGVRITYAGRRVRVGTPDLAEALAPFHGRFVIERLEPLGLLLPGAGAFPGAGRRWPPGLLRFLDRLEARLPFRPLVRLADHALVIVRKR